MSEATAMPSEFVGAEGALARLVDAVLAQTDPRRLRRGLAGFKSGAVQRIFPGTRWLGGVLRSKAGLSFPEVWLVGDRLESRCACVDEVEVCAHIPALVAAALREARKDPEVGARFEAPIEGDEGGGNSFWRPADPGEAPAGAAEGKPGLPEVLRAHLSRAPVAEGSDLAVALAEAYRTLRQT